MTWDTIATDGKAIGKASFLDNYWKPQPDEYNLFPAVPKYVKLEAIIHSIKPESFNSDFEVYDIKSEIGNDEWILHKEMKPFVHQVLDIPADKSLEGTVVSAYYSERTLVGFTKKQE